MFLKQVSVFIENREGRLDEILTILKNNGINIVSLCLADNTDYGMLRLIVTKPEFAREALRESGITAMLTDVIGIKLVHKVGMLQEILQIICKAGLNIEYMYSLETGRDDASIIFKTSEPAKAIELLSGEKVEFISQNEICELGEKK